MKKDRTEELNELLMEIMQVAEALREIFEQHASEDLFNEIEKIQQNLFPGAAEANSPAEIKLNFEVHEIVLKMMKMQLLIAASLSEHNIDYLSELKPDIRAKFMKLQELYFNEHGKDVKDLLKDVKATFINQYGADLESVIEIMSDEVKDDDDDSEKIIN